MIVRDVSGVGVDHNVEVDLNNIDQIEVVRGPSSLLYANGGVGGIINIVDSTIAREDFSESDLRLGLESQSVNDGETFDFSYQNNLGGLNFSLAILIFQMVQCSTMKKSTKRIMRKAMRKRATRKIWAT